jgi:hypothetical protein
MSHQRLATFSLNKTRLPPGMSLITAHCIQLWGWEMAGSSSISKTASQPWHCNIVRESPPQARDLLCCPCNSNGEFLLPRSFLSSPLHLHILPDIVPSSPLSCITCFCFGLVWFFAVLGIDSLSRQSKRLRCGSGLSAG